MHRRLIKSAFCWVVKHSKLQRNSSTRASLRDMQVSTRVLRMPAAAVPLQLRPRGPQRMPKPQRGVAVRAAMAGAGQDPYEVNGAGTASDCSPTCWWGHSAAMCQGPMLLPHWWRPPLPAPVSQLGCSPCVAGVGHPLECRLQCHPAGLQEEGERSQGAG